MRIVLDTNVLISGLLSGNSAPARVLGLWVSGEIEVAMSPAIIKEYLGVWLRPGFARLGSSDVRQSYLEQVIDLPNTLVVMPETHVRCIIQDPSDDRFLECALAAGVDMIVPGDEHLLALGAFKGIRIMGPRQFLDTFE